MCSSTLTTPLLFCLPLLTLTIYHAGDYNFIEFISNSKSGQFFFYSHDGQYMLKTQTKEENKFMIRILPHYYQYLTENPHSLLVRILGRLFCFFCRICGGTAGSADSWRGR